MSTTTTYTATAVREGRWWNIQVPEVGGHTQARRLADIETMARELIAVTLDVPLSAVAVAVSDHQGRFGGERLRTRRRHQGGPPPGG